MSTAAASRSPEHHTCDSCGCEEHRILYRFSVREIHLNIVRCAGCDAVYLSPRLRKDEQLRFYRPTYYSYERPIDPPERLSFKQRLRNSVLRADLGYARLPP